MNNLIGITDKDLIIFLAIEGLEIKDIIKESNRNRSIVYFEDNDKLKKAKLEYANKSKDVNIAEYIATEKRIMTLLYSQKQ